ncbi:signal recognition particle-docking protein FtsY [Latilactobacillus sakei]|uniref:signal recognition particle-docking protein FtsY n=1 Tax=Latilactobacillus sakei TaxID=1599 RepID=UPI0012AF4929|nr:signal recognition particle-docking protein FtsY [Latilactobacillus sakei]QGL61146.1 signal recognition particle-docking protein FtsY [Latilactobacillus sakei]
MGLFDRIKKAFTLEPEKEPENVDEQATTAEKEADDPAEKSTEKLDDSTGETDSGETPETPETPVEEPTEPVVAETPTPVEPEPEVAEPEATAAPEEAVIVTDEPAVSEEATVADDAEAEPVQAAQTEKYDQGLEKSRKTFGQRLNALFANFRSVDESFFDDVEEMLIEADVGYETAMKIADELREEVKLRNVKKPEAVSQAIVEKLVDLYGQEGQQEDNELHFAPEGELTVFLFVGVNGAGKTTSIGKFAHQLEKAGKKVLLAAGDTFRAGAIEQLQEWGRRVSVPVVANKAGSDPAAVAFDAVKRAKEENFDVLLVDTAGRLQNNVNLMKELEKVKRVITREIPSAPQEVLLVLDATTGQNALVQAKQFKSTTDVTGIVLTKLDGSAKGGIVLAVRTELHLPVKMVGLGEQMNDLQLFDPNRFVYGLFKDIIVGDGPQSEIDTDVSQAIK